MVKVTYLVRCVVECDSETKRDTIFNKILTDMQTAKSNGNITAGNVSKDTNEELEKDSYTEGV